MSGSQMVLGEPLFNFGTLTVNKEMQSREKIRHQHVSNSNSKPNINTKNNE